jgi:hypothetical protein
MSVGQSQISYMWNMRPDPHYIHAKFGEDSLKTKIVMGKNNNRGRWGRMGHLTSDTSGEKRLNLNLN